MFKKIMHLLCLKFKALFVKSEDRQAPAKQEATATTIASETSVTTETMTTERGNASTSETMEESEQEAMKEEAPAQVKTTTELGDTLASETLEESEEEAMQEERACKAEVHDALKKVPYVESMIPQEGGEIEENIDGFEILVTVGFEPEEPEETFLSDEASESKALTSQAETPEGVENGDAHEKGMPERVRGSDAMGDQQGKSPEEIICEEYPGVSQEFAHLICMSEDMRNGARYKVEDFGGSKEVLVQLNQQLKKYITSGTPFVVYFREADLKPELRLIVIPEGASDFEPIKESINLQRMIVGTLLFMGFRYDLDEQMYCWGEKTPCPEAGDRK